MQRRWFMALLLVFLTLFAYLPALQCGYIWDDDVYVTGNPLLTASDGLQRIWFAPQSYSAYFPMVNTTLRLEYGFWGLNPVGYHFVNILLHCINVLLVWLVLRKLGVPGSWLAAAIWAIHPVNVESVAWITELKNTQSTFFGLLTLLAWMKFTDRLTVHPWRFYALALLLYGPALFTKTTMATLPAAMVLILWLRKEPIHWRRLAQIVPFLGYGVGIGLLSVWCEARSGNYAEAVHYSYGGLGRLLIATRALWFYAGKLAWPTQLTFSYPRWEINPHDPFQYIWLIACIAVALLVWWRRNAVGRGTIAAIVFFVATLSPLLGFIPVYTFRYSFVADHYQYVASIGLIALFAGAVSRLADKCHLNHNFQFTLSISLLLVLGTLTRQQSRIYQGLETLWLDTLAKNPQSLMAHYNLGNLFLGDGRINDAILHYEQALHINPDYAEAHNNLANALGQAGRTSEAIEQLNQALRIKPDFAEAHYNLGNVFLKEAKFDDAIAHYKQAVRINPAYAEAYYNLGIALEQAGRSGDAIENYQEAVRINPDFIQAHYSLGIALEQTGKIEDAIGHYEQALRINPDFAEAHCRLGIALGRTGKTTEAIEQLKQALRINPDLTPAQDGLARLQASPTPAAGTTQPF